MRYCSTRDRLSYVSFRDAALAGLATDGGLFIPEVIPPLPAVVLSSLGSMDFRDVAFETIRPFVFRDIPDTVLRDLIQDVYPFEAPTVAVADRLVLELFHGPTAAFKDFGARFMARSFSYLRRGEDKPLHILVATSGDTGGAVADGFYGVPGISVTVLYPKGRVSPLQERQIAGLGGNISALAVEGSFDDCQCLVKEAFSDPSLTTRLALSSANSINVSRLIPQAVYYVASSGRIAAGRTDEDAPATPRRPGTPRRIPGGRGSVVFCVPSGNFGNLTAGLYAKGMGAPIASFVAATNSNRTIPDYLGRGVYEPRPSIPTISNAMDVGSPSNFERMSAHWSLTGLRSRIRGVWVDDDETKGTIGAVADATGYVLDPHGAVGWCAVDRLRASGSLTDQAVAVLATAHPAKFSETVVPIVGQVPVPPALLAAMSREIRARTIPVDLDALVAELPSV